MPLFCIGLSHHTAPVSVRERFAVSEPDLAAALETLAAHAGLDEVAILSTCNRVEIYASGDDSAPVADWLRRRGGAADFYRLGPEEAVRHLFRVASGLDSMVVGETEILGQVKAAYAAASGTCTTGPVLNRLFQQAFRAAKQARTMTGIARGAVSVGSAAAQLAAAELGDLSSRRVLLVGAGDAGELVARSLRARGAVDLAAANRTPDRAAELVRRLGGRTVPFAEWRGRLPEADIVIAAASAPQRLLGAGEVAPVMAARAGRPLFVFDLAVPRVFDPAIRELPGVLWHDIDSLQETARAGRTLREMETSRAEEIVGAAAEATVRRLFGAERLAAAA